MLDIDRMITTEMSANIVADLLKQGHLADEVAGAIDVPVEFVQRVQKKLHTLRHRDIEALAKLGGLTPQLLLLNSIRPIKPELKELFDAIREQLELSASAAPQVRKKLSKKRNTRSRAA